MEKLAISEPPPPYFGIACSNMWRKFYVDRQKPLYPRATGRLGIMEPKDAFNIFNVS
jgi:hypothetical protein